MLGQRLARGDWTLEESKLPFLVLKLQMISLCQQALDQERISALVTSQPVGRFLIVPGRFKLPGTSLGVHPHSFSVSRGLGFFQ